MRYEEFEVWQHYDFGEDVQQGETQEVLQFQKTTFNY